MSFFSKISTAPKVAKKTSFKSHQPSKSPATLAFCEEKSVPRQNKRELSPKTASSTKQICTKKIKSSASKEPKTNGTSTDQLPNPPGCNTRYEASRTTNYSGQWFNTNHKTKINHSRRRCPIYFRRTKPSDTQRCQNNARHGTSKMGPSNAKHHKRHLTMYHLY